MKIKYSPDLENKIVACVDCKHYIHNWRMRLSGLGPRCLRTNVPSIDLVTGKIDKLNVYHLDKCERERTDEYSANCGPQGKYWQPRKHTPENTMRVLQRTE